jgi:hypothetical protein
MALSVPLDSSALSSLANFLQLNHSVYPPDTECWNHLTSFVNNRDPQYNSFHNASRICAQDFHVNVTQPMVDFLNLTNNIYYYQQAYCTSLLDSRFYTLLYSPTFRRLKSTIRRLLSLQLLLPIGCRWDSRSRFYVRCDPVTW